MWNQSSIKCGTPDLGWSWYGQELPPRILRTFSSFLEHRTAAVRVGNVYTPPFDIKAGITQGAILPLMIYNIFVADMPKSRWGKNIIFVDDVSQIVHSRNKNLLQEYVEEEIFKLNAFEKKWKIRTSQQKFQIIAFERGPKKTFRVDATDRRKTIQDSNEARFLGLFLHMDGLSGPTNRRSKQAKVALT